MASSWVAFEIAREQGESDVDGSEVALTMRISWGLSSAPSFIMVLGLCFPSSVPPWQS